LLLVFAEFGEDGQGEDFAGGALCFREAAFFVSETLQRRLQMERDGVVDLRADFALGEELTQAVAARGADDVLMPDVSGARNLVGQDDAVGGIRAGFDETRRMKERVIAAGDGAAELVPAVDVLELDGEDRTLEAVHAGVPSDFVVIVAAAHSVLAQHAGALGDFVGVGGDHAGIPRRAEIFGGIKAEGSGVTERACMHALPLSSPSLRGVFNELEIALFCDAGERRKIGALAVKMNGEDGVEACALRTVENGFDGNWAEVECGRFDVGEEWRGSGAEDGADGGEETEGGGKDGVAGTDASGGKREPEGVSTRGAADGVGHAQLCLSGTLEDGNLLTQNELAGIEDSTERFEEFVVERLVLALEVEHGDRLGG